VTDTPAIELIGLTKVFRKSRKALDDLDLVVREGSVFGFLGPNGAGKTTTLRILAGLARPTAGKALIFGRETNGTGCAVKSEVGFLPDVPGFYPWMTARDFLRFAGKIFGLERDVLDERIEALLGLASLGDADGKIGGFSRGMRQRLGVAQALINAPRLLLLDEPTSALDPIGRKELLEMVGSLRGRTTVFFSTHILSDVERVCDAVAILNNGRLVTEAPIGKLKSRFGSRRIVIELDGSQSPGNGPGHADARGPSAFEAALRAQPWLVGLEPGRRPGEGFLCSVSDLPLAQRAIPALVASLGLGIRRMEVDDPSLEDVFVELLHKAGHEGGMLESARREWPP
jgi:ABC-2 type transport system ATP-binding protein